MLLDNTPRKYTSSSAMLNKFRVRSGGSFRLGQCSILIPQPRKCAGDPIRIGLRRASSAGGLAAGSFMYRRGRHVRRTAAKVSSALQSKAATKPDIHGAGKEDDLRREHPADARLAGRRF